MNSLELTARDLRRVEGNLERARRKPNAPPSEIARLEELCRLRREIYELVRKTE